MYSCMAAVPHNEWMWVGWACKATLALWPFLDLLCIPLKFVCRLFWKFHTFRATPSSRTNWDTTSCEHYHTKEKNQPKFDCEINKIIHCYCTVCYTVASSKLLLMVFICLHEIIFETFCNCDRVRKATEQGIWLLFGQCKKDHMWRKVSFCEFLISGGGQMNNPALYDEKFLDKNDEPTCSLKIIRPKYTQLYQRCNVYFYRQVKNYSAKFHSYPIFIADYCKVII
jgi:hypothetical protein